LLYLLVTLALGATPARALAARLRGKPGFRSP